MGWLRESCKEILQPAADYLLQGALVPRAAPKRMGSVDAIAGLLALLLVDGRSLFGAQATEKGIRLSGAPSLLASLAGAQRPYLRQQLHLGGPGDMGCAR
jgi:hypothetical protein